MTTDQRAHPWPDDGKWIEFRWRRGVWALARPWYGVMPLTALHWLSPMRLWFPFVTIRTKWFHCYYGWKPIPLGDAKFYWRDLDQIKKWRNEGRLFVQLSGRQGVGDIS